MKKPSLLKQKAAVPPGTPRQEGHPLDRAVKILLVLLAFLIPLKFGLPNLDIASPTTLNDLSSPWPEEIAQILIILVFFLWGVRSLSRGDFVLRVGLLDAMMGLFLLIGLLATFLSPSPHSSVVILKQFVSYALLYTLAVNAVDDPRQRRTLLKWFLASTSIVAMLALYQFVFGFEEIARDVRRYVAPQFQEAYLARISRRRVFSVFVYPNSLAGFLLVAFPLTLLYPALHKEWFKKANLHKLVAYSLVLPLPCFVSFLLTQSKAGFLAFALVAVGFIVAARRRLRLKPKALAAALLAALVLLSAALISPPGRRLIVEKGRYTLSERVDYWRAGFRMIPRSPIVGSGFNSFGVLYPQYRLPGTNESRSAHNNYLQILIETGVLGLAFFLGIWIVASAAVVPFLKRSLRSDETFGFRDTVGLSLTAGIVGFLVHSLADFDLYVPGIGMTVWLLLGLQIRNADSLRARRVRLAPRTAALCTLGLLAVSGAGILFTSKTLNANSHLAVAQSILQRANPPAGFDDYEEAVQELKAALKWDPTNHNLHLSLGRVYYRLDRYDDALREFALADRLHRFAPMIAHDIARTKLARMEKEGFGEWDDVLAGFRRATRYSDSSSFHHLVYAYYLAESGRPEESQYELRKVRKLDPSGEESIKAARMIYRQDPFVAKLQAFLAQAPEESSDAKNAAEMP